MLAAGPSAMAQQLDKTALHAEMASLEQQITVLKPQAGSSSEAARALADAMSRCAEISASLGGDRAAPQGQGGTGGTRGSSPTPPPNCTPATATFTQSTPVPIVDVAVSSSTLVVAGAGTFVWDLNLSTNITHTFAADMDITLQSPAGTVVTLSTDNGAGNDNTFNGTAWDDDANPAGQVPYVTNNGVATDHAYVNLTTATPLVIEEALAAFAGENPNGTWTLTVSDDLAGDVGSIDSWSLEITTFNAAPLTAVTAATQSTPVPIVDVAVSSSTLVVAGAGTSLCDMTLTTNITHTFAADMDITLQSPAGTVVTLSTDNGAGNDNVFNGTVWDDDANPGGQVPYVTNAGVVTDHPYVNLTTATPLVPEEAFGAFTGEDPNGTWTLTVSDDLAGDIGSIDSWSLNLTTCTCVAPNADLSVAVTATNSDPPLTIGDTITFNVTATNNGPGPATGVVVTTTLSSNLTYVSNTCGATAPPPSVVWNIGAMPASTSQVCQIVATVNAAGDPSATTTITGVEVDPVPGNNTAVTGLGGVIVPVPVNRPLMLVLLGLMLAGLGAAAVRRTRRV